MRLAFVEQKMHMDGVEHVVIEKNIEHGHLEQGIPDGVLSYLGQCGDCDPIVACASSYLLPITGGGYFVLLSS